MSYQVIARKYRPQRFDDVVGQEHVTQTLANAIRSERIAHAYLFCGPRGTGKTTVARIFAKALNCTGGPKAEFDDTDPRCREIAEGRALDVLEIDGASNNGVEQVRELRDTARFAPASSKFKIYIIDEVHMLTTAAFNALLKTLEEPPAHVKFLFATTDPEKVLPTILSRCQRFDLRRIPTALIVRHLGAIAKAEGVHIDEAALHAIARGADGGMRDAESTLDQLISFCGERIEENDVLSMFGLAARAQLLGLARALLQSDASAALREVNDLARSGKDLGRMLNDLLHHFRNLMVFHVAGGDLGLLEVSESEAAELQTQSTLAPVEAVSRMLEVLTSAEGRLRDAVARKIFLEVTLLKVIQARNAVSLDTVLRQLNQLREAGGGGGSGGVAPQAMAAPTPTSPPVVASNARSSGGGGSAAPLAPVGLPSVPASVGAVATVAEASVAPPPGGASPRAVSGDPVAVWAQIVAVASPMSKSALQAGQPVSWEKGVLTVGYGPGQESQMMLVDVDRTRRGIEARLAEFGYQTILKFVKVPGQSGPVAGAARETTSGGGPTAASPTPAPRPAAPLAPAASPTKTRTEKVVPIKLDPVEFRNDPLIKEAIEVFKGQLVEVRRADDNPAEA